MYQKGREDMLREICEYLDKGAKNAERWLKTADGEAEQARLSALERCYRSEARFIAYHFLPNECKGCGGVERCECGKTVPESYSDNS